MFFVYTVCVSLLFNTALFLGLSDHTYLYHGISQYTGTCKYKVDVAWVDRSFDTAERFHRVLVTTYEQTYASRAHLPIQ